VAGSSPLLGAVTESEELPVLRVLVGLWEQALATLSVPRHADCEEAVRRCAMAPRETLALLERTLATAGGQNEDRLPRTD